MNETNFVSFVLAAKEKKLSLVIVASGFLCLKYFRFILWLAFLLRRSLDRRRSISTRLSFDVNEPVYLWSKGARCRRSGKRRREKRARGGEQSAIVISYPSRPRLVKPLDTGLENVNRSSTVRRLDGSRLLFKSSFARRIGSVPTDQPFREKETVWDHLTRVEDRVMDAGSLDCLQASRSCYSETCYEIFFTRSGIPLFFIYFPIVLLCKKKKFIFILEITVSYDVSLYGIHFSLTFDLK